MRDRGGPTLPRFALDALRARLLDDVRRAPLRYAPFYDRLKDLFDLDEPALLAVLERSLEPSAWEPYMPGAHAFHLQAGPLVAGADAGLVRMKAGLVFPSHVHLGDETALVLEGSYRESTGRVYQAGDVHAMAAGSRHAYDVLPGSPLVFAVVLHGGIELDQQLDR
jgi:anti-sigma factor ChrR (cupin superfamily)